MKIGESGMRRRLIVILAIGAALIVGAAVWRHLRPDRSEGHGPAGPAVAREAFAKPWSARKVFLIGVGDSVTAGYGSSPGHSYFERLLANPGDEFPDMRGLNLRAGMPNLQAKNLAVNGSTSLDHIETLRNKLPDLDGETLVLVVMTTGGNDIIHNYGRSPPREGAMYGAAAAQAAPWVASFEKRLNDMLDIPEARYHGRCHVFLADIFDPTDEVGDIENAGLPLPAWPDGEKLLAAYNEVIRRAAAKRPNVHLVPMRAEFLGHGIHCRQQWRKHYRKDDPHYWYYVNLEDPNDRGYDAIRRLFLIEMAKVLPALDRLPPAAPKAGGPPVDIEERK
jgi:lysophospholipase L1-like esterase